MNSKLSNKADNETVLAQRASLVIVLVDEAGRFINVQKASTGDLIPYEKVVATRGMMQMITRPRESKTVDEIETKTSDENDMPPLVTKPTETNVAIKPVGMTISSQPTHYHSRPRRGGRWNYSSSSSSSSDCNDYSPNAFCCGMSCKDRRRAYFGHYIDMWASPMLEHVSAMSLNDPRTMSAMSVAQRPCSNWKTASLGYMVVGTPSSNNHDVIVDFDRRCNRCGMFAKANPNLTFITCGGCQMVCYCSQACREADWIAVHANECVALRAYHRNPCVASVGSMINGDSTTCKRKTPPDEENDESSDDEESEYINEAVYDVGMPMFGRSKKKKKDKRRKKKKKYGVGDENDGVVKEKKGWFRRMGKKATVAIRSAGKKVATAVKKTKVYQKKVAPRVEAAKTAKQSYQAVRDAQKMEALQASVDKKNQKLFEMSKKKNTKNDGNDDDKDAETKNLVTSLPYSTQFKYDDRLDFTEEEARELYLHHGIILSVENRQASNGQVVRIGSVFDVPPYHRSDDDDDDNDDDETLQTVRYGHPKLTILHAVVDDLDDNLIRPPLVRHQIGKNFSVFGKKKKKKNKKKGGSKKGGLLRGSKKLKKKIDTARADRKMREANEEYYNDESTYPVRGWVQHEEVSDSPSLARKNTKVSVGESMVRYDRRENVPNVFIPAIRNINSKYQRMAMRYSEQIEKIYANFYPPHFDFVDGSDENFKNDERMNDMPVLKSSWYDVNAMKREIGEIYQRYPKLVREGYRVVPDYEKKRYVWIKNVVWK